MNINAHHTFSEYYFIKTKKLWSIPLNPGKITTEVWCPEMQYLLITFKVDRDGDDQITETRPQLMSLYFLPRRAEVERAEVHRKSSKCCMALD